MSNVPVQGVILAGGEGRRLGRDKTGLRLPGAERDFLETAASMLQDIGVPAHISCSPAQQERAARLGLPVVADCFPGEGALRAVYSALKQLQAPCLVIGCDMPFLRARELRELLIFRDAVLAEVQCAQDAFATGQAVTLPEPVLLTAWRQQWTGYVEWLAAVYEPEALPWLEAAIVRKEYRLGQTLPPEQCRSLDFGRERALVFHNVNTPEQWEEAVQAQKSGAGER